MFLILIIFVIFGLALGSFINMAVYRIDKGERFFGRSYCDFCHKQLKLQDLLPVFSYIVSLGRCRYCHKKLPFSYPVVELLSAGLSVLALYLAWPMLLSGDSLDFLLTVIVALGFFEFLLFFAVYDFRFWELDVLSLKTGIVFGLLLNLVSFIRPLPFLTDPLGNIVAAVILAGIIFCVVLITDGGGMGEGDIYLFGFVGLFTGIDSLLLTFMLIVTSGAFFGLIKAAVSRKFHGLMIQFAPFICIGAVISFVFHDQIMQIIGNFAATYLP